MARPMRWLALVLLVAPAPLGAQALPEYPPPAEVREAFLKQLDRPRVPLDARSKGLVHEKGLVVEKLDFASEKKADGTTERVPVLLIKPEGTARFPVVIVLHGTGGGKEGMRSWLEELARRGIAGVAIDARYHGERSGGAKGKDAYVAAITRAWRTTAGEPMEHPFYFDTVWDLWRTVDYLQSRPDLDGGRIGMLGISMGGIETWLAAAIDERVRVAVPAIGVQSFRWGLDNDHWQGRAATIGEPHQAAARDLGEPEVNRRVCEQLWNKVIPGILSEFDCPSMLRLFAGRPLLVLNGEKDPNCPIEGARVAFAVAEKAFADLGASDHLKILVAEGVGHAVTSEQHQAALDWFTQWLKP